MCARLPPTCPPRAPRAPRASLFADCVAQSSEPGPTNASFSLHHACCGCRIVRLQVLNKVEDEEAEQAFQDDDPDSDDSDGRAM